MTRVKWTRPALRQLEEIGDYIARDSPRAAARMIERIFERTEALAKYPDLGRAGRIAETRELVAPETPFIIVYRVRDGETEILAVFHGARRWPDNLG